MAGDFWVLIEKLPRLGFRGPAPQLRVSPLLRLRQGPCLRGAAEVRFRKRTKRKRVRKCLLEEAACWGMARWSTSAATDAARYAAMARGFGSSSVCMERENCMLCTWKAYP